MKCSITLLLTFAACGAPDYDAAPFSADLHEWPYLSPEQVDDRRTFAHPVSEEELAAQLDAVFEAGEPALHRPSPELLRQRVARGLNIDFMLDGFDERARDIRIVASEDHGAFVWHHVRISDEIVRDLELDYLEPKTGARVAGVVGLHGHYDDSTVFAEDYLGLELVRRGYAVAAPRFRHMDCGDDERDQAVYLLREGFSLMTYRVYEAMLAVEFLRTRAIVDPERVALAGHSGGSSTANLVVRLSDRVAAVVTDFQVEYRNACGGQVHCETVPALFVHAADINDRETLAIPHLRVDYGFGDDDMRASILTFLDTAVAAR